MLGVVCGYTELRSIRLVMLFIRILMMMLRGLVMYRGSKIMLDVRLMLMLG